MQLFIIGLQCFVLSLFKQRHGQISLGLINVESDDWKQLICFVIVTDFYTFFVE